MSTDKLEPRLQEYLEQENTRQTAAGAKAKITEKGVQVTISHAEYLKATSGDDPTAGIDALAARIRRSTKPIVDRLDKLGIENPTVHSLTNAVTAVLTHKQMAEIAKLDEVQLVRLDTPQMVTCMNQSVNVIEVPQARQDFNADGKTIRVAVLDTGIDATHPALAGRVTLAISTQGGTIQLPTPPGSHGTHCAGTIASNDPVFRGMAPQAELIDIQVLNAGGFGTPSALVLGLDQAVRAGALIASLSLGWSVPLHGWVCGDADCILCQAADNASLLGMTVVVAAGNEGNSFPGQNVRHPSSARHVITVGAVDKSKVLAAFSSIGPSTARVSPGAAIRLTKPDVCAPGVAITSTVVGGGFASFNGTSMATPHVAGLLALMFHRNSINTPGVPNVSPRMAKKMLEETCEPLPLTPNQAGYGVVNAYGALMRSGAAGPRSAPKVLTSAAGATRT